MASGSFEIDSYSWFRSLPLSNCVNAYPQGTMFAVGECAFLNPYTFYQYQSSVGFVDTSTLSNAQTSTNSANLISTTATLMSSIYENRKQIVSTIPLTRWIYDGNVSTFPIQYVSTYSNLHSTAQSTIPSSFIFQFPSSGLFGYITSNVYPSCAPYSLFSTIPVLISSFVSTTNVPTTSNFISTYTTWSNLVTAPSEIFDFVCTFSTTNYADLRILFSNVWLGDFMASSINTRQYDVFVDYQYSIYISTNLDPFMWTSTLGRFSYTNTVNNPGYIGANTNTRLGNYQYSEVHVKQMFTSNSSGTQILNNPINSNFYTTVVLNSSIHTATPREIFVDIFAPGANNYTFTLVPR